MIAAEKIVAGSVADVQAARVAADVVRAAFEDELLVWIRGIAVCAGDEEAELERRRAAIEDEDGVVVCWASDALGAHSGHVQLVISGGRCLRCARS